MDDLKIQKESQNSHYNEITVKCEFCGFEFKKCDGLSCEGCPINCNIVRCPNCGYELLPESKSYKFMENVFKKIKNIF
ncbi:MAG: hypothetical protein MJ232_03880 [archaeon]|nr:hypothetical protein [archaeon]